MAGSLDIGTLIGGVELEDRLTPTMRMVESRLASAGRAIGLVDTSMSQLGSTMQTTGRFIAMAGDRLSFLTAPLILAAGAATRFGMDFESTMLKVHNLAGVGEEAVKKMREEVLSLGPAVGRGPNELAEGLYAIASVGMRGKEAMEILTVSAKASAVGLGETNDIARAVVASMTAYGKENLSAAAATDMLLAAVREGGAEADQFANTLGRVIGTAKQVGITYDEVLASIATFTRVGVRADEAVTALRGTMAMLMKPTAGARDMLEELGTSIQQVRDKVKKDGLADALIDLVSLAGANEDALGKIIPNVRALAGVLANTGEQAQAYRDIQKEIINSSGDLDAAFENTTKTVKFMWEQFKATLEVIAIESNISGAFGAMLESIRPLVSLLGEVVDAFIRLPSPVQTAITALLGITLLSGPIGSFAGRMVEVIGIILGPRALGAVIPGLAGYTTALGLNTAALNANAFAQVRQSTAILSAPSAVTRAVQGATTGTGTFTVMSAGSLSSTSTDLSKYSTEVEKAVSWTSRLTGSFTTLAGTLRFLGLAGLFITLATAIYEVITNLEKYTAPQRLVGEAIDATSSKIREIIDYTKSWLGINKDTISSINDVGEAVEKQRTIFEEFQRTFELVWRGFVARVTWVWENVDKWIAHGVDNILQTLIGTLEQVGVSSERAKSWFINIGAYALQAIPGLKSLIIALAYITSEQGLGASLRKLNDEFEKSVQTWEQRAAGASGISGVTMARPEGGALGTGIIAEEWVVLGHKNLQKNLEQIDKEIVNQQKLATQELSADVKKRIAAMDEYLSLSPKQIADKLSQGLEIPINEAAVKNFLDGQKKKETAINSQIAAQDRLKKSGIELSEQQKDDIFEALKKKNSVEDVAKAFGITTAQVKQLTDEWKLNAAEAIFAREEIEKIDIAAEELNEKFEIFEQKEVAKWIGEEIELMDERLRRIDDIHQVEKTLEDEITTLKLRGSAQRIKQIDLEYEATIRQAKEEGLYSAELDRLAKERRDYLKDEETRLDALERKLTSLGAAAVGLRELGDAFKNAFGGEGISAQIGQAVGTVISGVGQIVDAYAQGLQKLEEYKTRGFGPTSGEKVGAVLSAGASVIGATGEGSTLERMIGGAVAGAGAAMALGAAWGTTAGPVGVAIGAVAGLTVGLVRGALAATEYEKRVREAAEITKKLQREAIDAYGGMDRLSTIATIVGINIKEAFSWRDPEALEDILQDVEEGWNRLKSAVEEYDIAISELNAETRLILIGELVDDLVAKHRSLTLAGVSFGRATEAMAADINSVLEAALLAGDGIPEALGPIIRSLIEMGLITENNAALMLGLTSTSVPSLAEIEDAAKRYGLTLDDIGGKVPQLMITEAANQIVKDWGIFERAGLSVSEIIDIVGDDINDLVIRAMESGLALPETMKPYIESLIKAGELVDGNGEKITDISQIQFTRPLVAAIDDLIAKLQELIDKFIAVGNTKVPPVTIPVVIDYPEGTNGPKPRPGDPDTDIPNTGRPAIPMAAGGDWIVNRPTLFLAGEAGVERATFSGAGRTTHSFGDVEQTLMVLLERDVVAKASFRGMPRVAKVRGVRS